VRTLRCTLVVCALLFSPATVLAQPIEVEGAQWAEFDAQTGVWTLRGEGVRVRRGDWWVEARLLRYRASDGTFEAQGAVRAQQGEVLSVAASSARGSVRQGWGELEGEVEVRYRADPGVVALRAPRARVDFSRRSAEALGGVEVTWREAVLQADRVSLDGEEVTAQGQPVATWARLRLEAGWMRAALITATLWALAGVRGEHPLGTFRSREAEVRWREQAVTLRGDVRVDRGGDRLEAEEVRYDWSTGRAVASGRARVVVRP
jgi:lipopolysaccharide export system protein LptA